MVGMQAIKDEETSQAFAALRNNLNKTPPLLVWAEAQPCWRCRVGDNTPVATNLVPNAFTPVATNLVPNAFLCTIIHTMPNCHGRVESFASSMFRILW
jgi:hypothetical protein